MRDKVQGIVAVILIAAGLALLINSIGTRSAIEVLEMTESGGVWH